MSFIDIPVFAGQGTQAVNAPQTRERAMRHASSPAGSLLLSTCFEAFHCELSSLSSSDATATGVEAADFDSPQSLLTVPQERYHFNPVISGTSLFLIQALGYLDLVESRSNTSSKSSFLSSLEKNRALGFGVLGFSSGILPACVVGTSASKLQYLVNAVSAFKVAFWIGVRTQLYRRSALQEAGAAVDDVRPWSLVFLGMTRSAAEEAISRFSQSTEDASPLYVTAITDETCVTISGRPDSLASFASALPPSIPVHKTSVDTLYHSSVHTHGARADVLADLARRHVSFPAFSDLHTPIRSTFTGALLEQNDDVPLVEAVVDMVLTQPVNWDRLVASMIQATPEDQVVRLVNIGPGAGLTRSMERAFPLRNVLSLDLTAVDKQGGAKPHAPAQEPIAIVGMAVNMPGAPDIGKLWEVLEHGINTIAEIPEHRFKVSDYNDPSSAKSGRSMKAHTGNFIDDADGFDNKFFKISPREARSMDPQSRVLLHTAYEAMEDAGYVPGSSPTFSPESVGCYIGVATLDYVQNLRNDIDVYYSTGTLRAFLSGRISYAMQLGGPSVVIDTACSSSLVAIYQACRALMNGDCTSAMAGGVNVVSSPDMFLGLDRAHFLSPTGQCKAFDASADGYSRSEGCGLFVLKRLSDAVAENDHILGVIRGVEVNQSGLAHSITHPHAPTQVNLFNRILERSGIDATRVNVVEAHGTGTQAGDPNELESIRGVFAARRTPKNPLHITSVKANIGHLEAASGAAGLAKLLLMMQHRTIPRLISLKNLNPRILDLIADNTIIDTEHAQWLPSEEGLTRIALLNNFGAAGSNGALLLEEHVSPTVDAAVTTSSSHVIGLSAKTPEALDALRTRYVEWLSSPASDGVPIDKIAYTATARRRVYEHRLAVSASNREELAEKLKSGSPSAVFNAHGKVAFVFSGQGGQYLGMGSALYKTVPLFKQIVDECHSFLTSSGFPGVIQIIAPESSDSGLSQLEEFEANQAAIFALEYALAKLWMSWGVSPEVVVGHSLGEYAAQVIAGVLTLKGALTIIANRVRFMVQKCAVATTGMIAVNLGSDALQAILQTSPAFSEAAIACYNSISDCVVSGPIEQLKALKAHLDAEVRCKNILLAVPFGYHSAAMAPFLDDLTLVARHVTIRAPTIPIISNAFGCVVLPGDDTVFNAEYYARHCAAPVQFEKGITALSASTDISPISVWIEVGPHTTTLPMLKVHPAVPNDSALLASIRKSHDAWTTLSTTLAQLYTSSVTLQWRKVFDHLPSVSCISLPAYPWNKSKFWVEFKEESPVVVSEPAVAPESSEHLVADFSMLHTWAQFPTDANGRVAIYQTPISQLAKSISGHSVGDHPLCPASVYHELALAGIQAASSHLDMVQVGSFVQLRDVDYAKPLVYNVDVPRVVKTTITLKPDQSGSWTVGSVIGAGAEDVHCSGNFKFAITSKTATKFSRTLPAMKRQITTVINGKDIETFSTRTAYEVIFPRVVDYSKEYHTMKALTVSADGMEGYATVQLPQDYDRGRFVIHPVFMDTMLHVAGFVANMQGGVNDAFICSKVESVKAIPEQIDNDARYGVYISNAWVADEGVMLADACAVELNAPNRIVAQLKGMHFRKVRLSSLKRGLAMAAGGSKAHAVPALTRPALAPVSRAPAKLSLPPQHSRSDSQSSVDVQAEVARIVAETCDTAVSNLDVNANLETFGVDSLMSIEIFSKLQTTFSNGELDPNALSSCQTVADITREVKSKVAFFTSGPSSPSTLVVSEDKLAEAGIPSQPLDQDFDVKPLLAAALGLGAHEITDDADFESLGLDSLTSIEAHHALQNEFALQLPEDLFISHTTAKAIHAFISAELRARSKTVDSKTVMDSPPVKTEKLQPSQDMERLVSALNLNTVPISVQKAEHAGRAPLFLIHDGSGLVNYIARLSRQDRDLWGIHNPHFISSQPWDSVVAMAAEYGNYAVQTTSEPLLLGGWSFGGVVAFEAARQLLKKGVAVKGVVLIDSPCPLKHVPLSDALIDSVARLDGRNTVSDVAQLVKRQFQMNSRMLGHYDPLASGGPYPRLVLLRSSEGFNPAGVPDVPVWLADRSDPRQAVAGWEGIVGTSVKTIDIPGHHFQPFHTANIAGVSRAISEGSAYLDNSI
ncbi:polyketide synthase [Auriscalpium vulgare]|uniref:Polyketide synthase n=1 Tax=Auriscalpium vulgare TaxID=40419 RepID=A0ACB8S5F3_9AGAM|nr:polyketide synthase [Auriscalpium vulgare]